MGQHSKELPFFIMDVHLERFISCKEREVAGAKSYDV